MTINKVEKNIEYHIYAKFLGTYMPEDSVKIGNCKIAKEYYFLDDDRIILPIRNKSSEFHLLGKGLKNFIIYPREPIPTRTFESEYIIKTRIVAQNEYWAVREAKERFFNISTILSIIAKNETVKIGNKTRRVDYETYDFEVVAIFIEKNNKLVRLKLPSPGTSGRNFFPKKFPNNFLDKAEKYLQFNDSVFQKGLVYFQRATFMKHSGFFGDLETTLNFVKCVELICNVIGDETKCGLPSKTQFEKKKKIDGMKWVYNYVGSEMNVNNNFIEAMERAWDARNNMDIAHGHEYYNPINKLDSNNLSFLNYEELEACAAEFLRKYYQYRIKM